MVTTYLDKERYYMKKLVLGNTGIEVTELCFGALPMGPLQKNLPVEDSAEIVKSALQKGVTFIDTAQGYKTYLPIRKAIKETGIRPVIATKSPASDYDQMEAAINEALEMLDLDYIDIFHLHAARAATDVFDVRSGAFQCLLDYKAKGKIKAVGISTHSVKVAAMAADIKEIDVVFPIINIKGLGILEGTREEMEVSIKKCINNGKGVYLMKALAGGNLVNDFDRAMSYTRNVADVPVALGMVSLEEVDFNIAYFNGEDTKAFSKNIGKAKKFYPVPSICIGCGSCERTCPNHAIELSEGKKARIDYDKCIQCGYCVGSCKSFAIRMI